MGGSDRSSVIDKDTARLRRSSPGSSPQPARAGGPSAQADGWSLCEIRRLREENELLRQSAQTFGALAERLHVALQRERSAQSTRSRDARSH